MDIVITMILCIWVWLASTLATLYLICIQLCIHALIFVDNCSLNQEFLYSSLAVYNTGNLFVQNWLMLIIIFLMQYHRFSIKLHACIAMWFWAFCLFMLRHKLPLKPSLVYNSLNRCTLLDWIKGHPSILLSSDGLAFRCSFSLLSSPTLSYPV